MKLLDLVIQEFFAVVEHLMSKIQSHDNKLVVTSQIVYGLLDKNLYIKRNDKLKIYRQFNFIVCNSNGFTSAIYDKEAKKTKRKIVFDLNTYKILKALYEQTVKK